MEQNSSSPKTCASCGHELVDSALRFCTNCGVALASEPTEEPVATPEETAETAEAPRSPLFQGLDDDDAFATVRQPSPTNFLEAELDVEPEVEPEPEPEVAPEKVGVSTVALTADDIAQELGNTQSMSKIGISTMALTLEDIEEELDDTKPRSKSELLKELQESDGTEELTTDSSRFEELGNQTDQISAADVVKEIEESHTLSIRKKKQEVAEAAQELEASVVISELEEEPEPIERSTSVLTQNEIASNIALLTSSPEEGRIDLSMGPTQPASTDAMPAPEVMPFDQVFQPRDVPSEDELPGPPMMTGRAVPDSGDYDSSSVSSSSKSSRSSARAAAPDNTMFFVLLIAGGLLLLLGGYFMLGR